MDGNTQAEFLGEMRRFLFAVKLLPDHCAASYIEKIPHTSAQLAAALDYRFSYDELREIVQEADEKGWWPTSEWIDAYLKERWPTTQHAEPLRTEILSEMALVRAFAFDSPTILEAAASNHGCHWGCHNQKFWLYPKDVVLSVLGIVYGATRGELSWREIGQTEVGVRAALSWLDLAFFDGRPMRTALDSLRQHLRASPDWRTAGFGSESALELYCAACAWCGWREGLEALALRNYPFAEGCRRVLAGDLKGAQARLLPAAGELQDESFAAALLRHSVCMAVEPSIKLSVEIMQGCRSSYTIHSSCSAMKHLREAYAAIQTNWVRKWGKDGKWKKSPALVAPPDAASRLDGALRLAWQWYSEKGSECGYLREKVRESFGWIAQSVANGYLNIGGIFLSLVPEMAEEPAAKSILAEMGKRGVWLLPFESSKQNWEQFLAALRGVFETSRAAPPVEVERALRAGCGRIVWELTGVESANGTVSVDRVCPVFRERRADGTESREEVQYQNLSRGKCGPCVSSRDIQLADRLKGMGWYNRCQRDESGRADILELLCGMENLEWFDKNAGGSLTGTPIRIESRPCVMSTVTTEDGGMQLRLSGWRFGRADYALFRTAEKGVLAFTRIDEKARRVADIFNAFENGGSIQLPVRAQVMDGDVLEKLGEVIKRDDGDGGAAVGEVEVRVKTASVIRLSFEDGCLAVHVWERPIRKNLELLFEPGFGLAKRLVMGSGGNYVLVRDLEEERKNLSAIRQEFAEYEQWFDGRCSWQIDETDVALAFVERLQAMEPGVTLEWDKNKRLKVHRPQVKITSGGEGRGWFAIGGTFTTDGGKVHDVMEILTALCPNGSAYVQLANGDYVALTEAIRKQLGALAAVGQVKDKSLCVPRGALPFLSSVFGGEGVALPEAMKRAAEKVRAALALEPVPPKTLAAELRPYQLEGYRWLSRLAACGFGACLADDMGLGKTLQTITLLLERAKDGPSLVVAPASVCGNWRTEIRRFAPTLEPVVAMEGDEAALASVGPHTVVIASYGYLLFHEQIFADRDWNGLVLDEAQAIKNADAKRTKLVKSFKALFRVAATGTPVENRAEELWSIFDFLNPGLLGTREAFAKRSLAGIRPFVKPLVLRRLKGEVLDDLPQKTEVTRFVELDEDERAAYEACRLKAMADVAAASNRKRMGMLLAGLTRLRRFSCHPSLVLGSDVIPSAKLKALAELMEELREGGHRALVFSQFTDYLFLVRKMVDEKGWSAQYLDGETTLKERSRRVDAFQNGEGDFFLISLKAGGTGLNLTGADYVIILDPWWNPAAENQAADRAHRIGQRRPVTIYRLIARGTVEERVLDLHREKLLLSAELLDETASSVLTGEQLMNLLK